MDPPSGLVHLLVISPFPNLHINGSTTIVKPSMNHMCIIFGSGMVATSRFPMVTPHHQEILFQVVDKTSSYSCSSGSSKMQWYVVNVRPPWHFGIFIVINQICLLTIIDISEPCPPNGLTKIYPSFNHTFLVWAKETRDLYVMSGAGYAPFNILQNCSVAD